MEAELARRLEQLKETQLYRKLRRVDSPQGADLVIEGRRVVNFSSNDYLGLARSKELSDAAHESAAQWGSGSGASRLVCGSLGIHHQLEQALAAFKGTQAALSFPSGYAAAVGAVTALAGKDDFVVIDKLVHASIVDGARLSGATLRVFRHNDPVHLEEILKWCRSQPAPSPRQILLVTESLFSMDGDFAPLPEIVLLKDKYRAWLMVDEAHATGLFGGQRSGRVEAQGLRGRVEIQMATLGKAVGSSGGFIAGSQQLIDYLVNRARPFIFSTAPVPAAAGAALAGVRAILSEEGARPLERLRASLKLLQCSVPALHPLPENSPILPLLVGAEETALTLAQKLLDRGFLVPAIRYPTVARGKARLRITCSATHTLEDVQALAETLNDLL